MTTRAEKGLDRRARNRRSGGSQRPRRRWGHTRRNHTLTGTAGVGFNGWRSRFLF